MKSTPGNPEHKLAFRMELEQKLFAIPIPHCRKVVLRPGFMYGVDGQSSVSSMWFSMGQQGKAIYRGDRDKGWSWVQVSDLAEAYVRVAASGAAIDGEIFCIADEQRPTCVEVMQACLKAAGYTGEIEFAPPQEDDVTSVWFDQNEFITSRKAYRVAPGVIATDLLNGMVSDQWQKSLIDETPLRRIDKPEDIADVVAFLASEDARWITGEIIAASGGLW